MAQNYRNQPNRSDYGRGGRYQTGSERDRYRTGGEHRFNPDRNERDERAFEGDRSYSSGGYSEEFGYQRGRNRDDMSDRDQRGGNYASRGSSGTNYQSGRDYGRYDEGRFDEGNRWSEGARGQSDDDYDGGEFYNSGRRIGRSSWHEDSGDRGSYFNTGNYVDADTGSRGLSDDFYRAREQELRSGSGSRGRTSGDSYYGSQSSYGRDQSNTQRDRQRSWRDQSQRGSQWYDNPSGFGSQRSESGGGGNTGGYGYDYGSYARSQSFRGRGPQGYQRSDDRLKEMICERLTDDPDIDASNVTLEVTGQVVKLTGTVDDRRTKYEIEELIEHCGGVKDIDNQLRVQQQSGYGSQTGQQLRGGSDWESGSSSMTSSGRAGSTPGSTTTSGTSTSSSSSSSKRN